MRKRYAPFFLRTFNGGHWVAGQRYTGQLGTDMKVLLLARGANFDSINAKSRAASQEEAHVTPPVAVEVPLGNGAARRGEDAAGWTPHMRQQIEVILNFTPSFTHRYTASTYVKFPSRIPFLLSAVESFFFLVVGISSALLSVI
jgi:hypothetical protein